MRKIFLCIIFIAFSLSVFSQTKIDEYPRTDSDSEAARLDNFISFLSEKPESKGLVVIYSGENKARLGNILAFQNDIKQWISLRTIGKLNDRISFQIAEGKQSLYKELWLIEKGESLPVIETADINLNKLKTKYLYAFVCLNCEPAVPLLMADVANIELYKRTLEENPNYGALIIIRPNRSEEKIFTKEARKFASDYRKNLTKNRKLNKKRITIKIENSLDEYSAATAELYIIPK